MSRPRSPETELTGWYPGKIKPVRVGVYQRQSGDAWFWSYWTGKFWCVGWHSEFGADSCARGEREKSNYQYMQWRGLLRVVPEKK